MNGTDVVDGEFTGGSEGYDSMTGELYQGEAIEMSAPSSAPMRSPQPENRAHLAVGAAQAIAMAAREQAIVKARFGQARECPRDWMTVRAKLLAECDRPGFADAAIYAKPVGGKMMEGLSIRFAEACHRTAGNLRVSPEIVEEDSRRIVYRVSAIDLETNASWEKEVALAKTVERATVRDGQVCVGERRNTRGKTTFIILANEDEMMNKVDSALSKVSRNLILRLIPADIQDECRARCELTLQKGTAKNPTAARNALLDAFSAMGVSPDMVGAYLGHPASTITPVEITKLRPIYAALKEGETTWKEVMAAMAGTKPATSAPTAPTATNGVASSPAPVQAPAAAVQAPAPAPAQAAPPAPAPTPAPEAEDPIDREKGSIRAALAAALSTSDFKPILDRIRGLPSGDKSEMEAEYKAAQKRVVG